MVSNSLSSPPPPPLPLTLPLLPESQDPHQTLCGFEGPEKTMEIWFKKPSISTCFNNHDNLLPRSASPSNSESSCSTDSNTLTSDSIRISSSSSSSSTMDTGLRMVEQSVWDGMLEIVKAKVLSVTSNDFLDAYLLSESSMFVYPYRIVLKTCGTTTLLNALPRVLEIARDYCGLSVVDSFFYSRKAFMFPERQIFPHGKWSNEVEFLDAIFPATDFETSPYVVGKINSDHWCLYLANTTAVLEQDGVVLGEVEVEDDVTLEVMMYGLDKKTMKRFWKDYYSGDCGYSSGSDAMRATRIGELYPGSQVDEFLFDPCGYSMNGLVDKYYYTSHVTPEDHCSFASVETCVPVKELCQRMGTCLSSSQYLQYKSMGNVVEKIVDIYRPSSFSVVLFVNTAKSNYYSGRGSITTTCNWNNKNNNLSMLDGVLGAEELNKFELADRVSHNLGKWHVEFMHFEPKAAKCSASATTRRRQIHI